MKIRFIFILLTAITLHVDGQEPQLLKISNDHKYLLTADNKPFFWLGGTAWELIHRLSREETDLYLNDRHNKGFTVIQTVILAELDGLNTPNAYGHKPLIDNNPAKLNEKYFEHLDYVINKAGELGMYIGLLPSWGDKFNLKWGVGPVIFTPENAEKYGELIAQRYAATKNIIWILGGDRMPENDTHREIIEAMAKGIRKMDTLHLISYHPGGGQNASDAFNVEWLDIDMFQSGHDRTVKDFELVWKSRNVVPNRPVINGEPRYENHPDRFNPDVYGWMDDSDVRSAAYWSMLAGAAGYTYGCHDIWQMFTLGLGPITKVRTGWKEALQLPGSRQMMYMKNLLGAFPWQSLINDQNIIRNMNPKDQGYIVCAIGLQKDFIMAYTPWGRPIQPDLSRINAEKIKAFWFNPRSGESLFINTFFTTEQPIFEPWTTGRGSDLVLILLDENSKLKLP